jgi:hypothetical protein
MWLIVVVHRNPKWHRAHGNLLAINSSDYTLGILITGGKDSYAHLAAGRSTVAILGRASKARSEAPRAAAIPLPGDVVRATEIRV